MMIRRWMLVVALAGSAPTAFAAHAVRFELDVDSSQAGAWRIDLPLAVYREAMHGDLRDVEARNGRGDPVPLGPVPRRYGAPAPPLLETSRRKPFVLPALGDGVPRGEQLRVLVVRDAGGTLRRLDLSESADDSGRGTELLIDAGPADPLLVALDVGLDPAAGRILRARVVVLASDDLDGWRQVGAPQSLLRYAQDGRVLERRQVDLGGIRARYLLLRSADGTPLPKVAELSIRLRYQAPLEADWPQAQTAEAEFVRRGVAGEFFYRAPGMIPVDTVDAYLADVNSVADVTVSSRSREGTDWLPRVVLTAFRVAVQGEENTSLPVRIDGVRDLEWRITTDPPLAQPPVLRLSFVPDTWVLLAQGPGPFELVAGSAESRRPDWPLDTALDALAAQSGPGFRLPLATVGAPRPLDGDAARSSAPAPLPWRRIALWGVLATGALAIVVLVMRLLREREPAA